MIELYIIYIVHMLVFGGAIHENTDQAHTHALIFRRWWYGVLGFRDPDHRPLYGSVGTAHCPYFGSFHPYRRNETYLGMVVLLSVNTDGLFYLSEILDASDVKSAREGHFFLKNTREIHSRFVYFV